MPMQRELYPVNWNEIAAKVKDEAEWKCEECDRPCRKPGITWMDFVLELLESGAEYWYAQTCDVKGDGVVEKPQRFTLTVAHLNHKPEDCDRSNLKALCSGCHLRYDAQHHVRSRKAKNVNGQLELLEQSNDH
jgi:hypothetical protein